MLENIPPEMLAAAKAPQLGFLGSLLGAIAGPLIGGLFGSNENDRNRAAAAGMTQDDRNYDTKVRGLQNKQHWIEKVNDRRYSEELTADNRDHANSVLQDERRYLENKTRQDRGYAERVLADERDYARGITENDRRYAENKTRQDRGYMDRKRDEDIAQYTKDRNFMQNRSNHLAERTTASRGVDFTKLRDDAIAAGYNPMTALSMAHAYSTQVDYSLQGGVYSPGANYTAVGPLPASTSASGGGAGGGGGVAPPSGAVVGGQLPAGGGFVAPGSGYSGSHQPQLISTAGFIADAVDRAVDTGFNQPKGKDPLAEALRGALSQGNMAQEVRDADYTQNFGYDLTKQEPFKPSLGVGVPPLRSDQNQVLQPANSLRPKPNPMKQSFIRVRNPDGQIGRVDSTIARRMGIEQNDTLSAGDWAELVGEVGEIESALLQDKIRDTALDADLLGPRVDSYTRDYLESGTTGNMIMRSNPNAGWMDQFFQ